jgi:hypothetical protein
MTTQTSQQQHQPETKQQKYLRQFAVLSIAFSAVGLIIMAWLGIFGIVAGARALMLARHKDNLRNPKRLQYSRMATAGMILGIIDTVMLLAANG